jgi:putative endonuclease
VASVSTDLRHTLGETGERLAAEHLERRGYRILARRHRTRFGELDLVAYDGTAIVFVEVKTRRGTARTPWESLGPVKQEKVRRMAAAWLSEVRDRPWGADLRFDAIGVMLDPQGHLQALHHLENAF